MVCWTHFFFLVEQGDVFLHRCRCTCWAHARNALRRNFAVKSAGVVDSRVAMGIEWRRKKTFTIRCRGGQTNFVMILRT